MTTSAPYLLSGSFAYDSILLHTGHFHARILPEALARLNVAFGVNAVEEAFGGTGGNIAYNASLLGQRPLLVGALGRDGDRYRAHLKKHGLNASTLVQSSEATAHAWILTDSLNNQITAFHPGAMATPPDVPAETPDWWLLSPNHVGNTAALAKRGLAAGKQILFDPGQALPGFLEGHAEAILPLSELLANAHGLFVNDYEGELLCERTGKPLEHWVQADNHFVICTRGGQGLDLYTAQGREHFDVAPANVIVDPTGCGDALRAGFLYGLTQGWTLPDCARLGAVMGSFAIECAGGQGHAPTLATIFQRLETLG